MKAQDRLYNLVKKLCVTVMLINLHKTRKHL